MFHLESYLLRSILHLLHVKKSYKKNFQIFLQVTVIDHLKLEIWPGYVTHVEEKEGGLMLTCDVSHRVLRAETAYDVLQVLID